MHQISDNIDIRLNHFKTSFHKYLHIKKYQIIIKKGMSNNNYYICRKGRRVVWISRSLIWSKPLMELIFNPCDEFRRKPGGPSYQNPFSLPPRWCPWVLFTSFKVVSDDKERVGYGKQREATAHINPLQNCNLGSWVCGGRPAFGQNCSLCAWVCKERPALGQNILIISVGCSVCNIFLRDTGTEVCWILKLPY